MSETIGHFGTHSKDKAVPISSKSLCSAPMYSVNSLGDIYSPRGQLTPTMSGSGYLRVSTVHGTRYVHRLLAEAFIPLDDDPSLYEVTHLDGNKLNNSIDNLAWVKKRDRNDDIDAMIEQVVRALSYHPDRRKKRVALLNKLRAMSV